jgi:hypothetical protein
MEGKFVSEGLQAIDGDDDMLTAMARELVENKGIGESAQNVWRSLGQLRPESPARGTEEIEIAPTPQLRTCIPGVSEDTPRLPRRRGVSATQLSRAERRTALAVLTKEATRKSHSEPLFT